MMNVVFLFFWALIPGLQNPASASLPAAPQTQTAPPITNAGEPLGPSDVISVEVWTGAELVRDNFTIAPDGTIFLPFYLNELVPVAGLTTAEIRSLLLEKLRKNYRDPRVQVIPSVVQSKRALLIGDLGRTGNFPINNHTSLLEFVMSNGGAGPNSNLAEVQITRGGQRIHANLLEVLMGIDRSSNIKLQPGDVVFVPSLQTVSNKVFVIAGGLTVSLIQTAEKLYLLDALARSGGAVGTTGATAVGALGSVRWDKLYIIRSDPKAGATTVAYEIKFDDLYKKADLSLNVPLENGDILYLPKARLTRLQEVLTAVNPITSFIQSTIFFGAVFRSNNNP
jgi:polysaccharide biosynthesis/export protein